jgi:hypothetical protein
MSILLSSSLFLFPAGKRENPSMEWVLLSKDKRGFVLYPSGRTFFPFVFNYDHDEKGRLIEDYWHNEWSKIVEDFKEMKELGANVVRIHLQFAKFMKSPKEVNPKEIERLKSLIRLAEQLKMYLYITGLGCYRKEDVPSWYDKLNEKERWDAQAAFWKAISRVCSKSPAVFCYDLMNEPVVPGAPQDYWLASPFNKMYFVQFITLDPGNRSRELVAHQWINHLVLAIRKYDRRHLVTLGLPSWSLDRPGLTSGFFPEKIVDLLDFLSVHIYPENSKINDAIEIMKGFNVGKPVVIAELFPLHCSVEELENFLIYTKTTGLSKGWLSFYWGMLPGDLEKSPSLADIVTKKWIETFQNLGIILKNK